VIEDYSLVRWVELRTALVVTSAKAPTVPFFSFSTLSVDDKELMTRLLAMIDKASG
jgi:hypothetical protein